MTAFGRTPNASLEEDEVGDAARGRAARLHGDPEVGAAQREDVVDAVADHRDVAAVGPEDGHQAGLERRLHATEDARPAGVVAELRRRRGPRGPAGHDAARDGQADPAADRLDRRRVVAGDDLEVQAGAREPAEDLLDVGAQLLGEAEQGDRPEAAGQGGTIAGVAQGRVVVGAGKEEDPDSLRGDRRRSAGPDPRRHPARCGQRTGGAPITYVAPGVSPNRRPDQRRSEANGISSSTGDADPGCAAPSASVVRLGAVVLAARTPSRASRSSRSVSPIGSARWKAIRWVVSVPVLSTQSVSTRAIDSTAFWRCTRAPRRVIRRAPAA